MFSIIFQGFVGRNDTRDAAFLKAFGEYGCYRSLASDWEKYAPCELAANLLEGDAEDKAAILREAGILVEVVPTAEVVGVKHRAFECWPTHRAVNGECFSERDSVVVCGAPLNLRERINRWWKSTVRPRFWEFELAYNHEHPTNHLDRHGLRMARKRGAELGAALTECFPERLFLLVYRDEQVSFCSFTEELALGISDDPTSRRVGSQPLDEEPACFCAICECDRPYTERSQSDSEFPNAQFVDCAVCGNEVIVHADQEVVLANEAALRSFPTPEVPIDAWEHGTSTIRFPSSFEALKVAVGDRLHPSESWKEAAIRLWLGREADAMDPDQRVFAWTLLQIEELSALLLAYRVRQLLLPPENQDRSVLTPERLGIARDNPLYHPARRALAPVTVVTLVGGTLASHSLLNGTDERYSAGGRLAPDQPLYEGRFGYGCLDTRGREFWSTRPDGRRSRVVNDMAPHVAQPRTCKAYGAASSLKFIREQGTDRCMAFTLLYDEQKRVIAQHRRLFCRFHELDMEANPTVQMDLRDGTLTLRSDVFVWGVFFAWRNWGALADNAFDLLPGIPYSIPWDEDRIGTPTIWRTGNSLFSAG